MPSSSDGRAGDFARARSRQQRELGDETWQWRQARYEQHAADEHEAEKRHDGGNRDADFLVLWNTSGCLTP